jgi:hypothetical protein
MMSFYTKFVWIVLCSFFLVCFFFLCFFFTSFFLLLTRGMISPSFSIFRNLSQALSSSLKLSQALSSSLKLSQALSSSLNISQYLSVSFCVFPCLSRCLSISQIGIFVCLYRQHNTNGCMAKKNKGDHISTPTQKQVCFFSSFALFGRRLSFFFSALKKRTPEAWR